MEKKEKFPSHPDNPPNQVASTDPQADFLGGDVADTYLADSVKAEKHTAEDPGASKPHSVTVGTSATLGCCISR